MTHARPVPSRRGRRWDEDSIRAALSEFLRGRDVWPTYQEFIEGGAKGLRDALMRVRGVQWWASEMGLPGGARQRGGVQRWTDEAIRATLADFIGERPTWPSWQEFNAAGLHAFREALRHYGDAERWAKEMGVVLPERRARRARRRPRSKPTPPPSRPRRWPLWTEQRIASELTAFLRGRDEWPRYVEFVAAGQKNLYKAILRHGGTQPWARRMSVQWVTRHGGNQAYWNQERIREQLANLLAGRSDWPTGAEFELAGQRPLLVAIRRFGGVEYWARQFDVDVARRRSDEVTGRVRQRSGSRSGARVWDDARIAAAIKPLVDDLGRWPTKGEFRHAGLSRALSAVYDHGGSALWRQRLGVPANHFSGPLPERRRWTEQRIEAELRALCAGRSRWPAHREFAAAGATALYRAAIRHGGVERWRAVVELD